MLLYHCPAETWIPDFVTSANLEHLQEKGLELFEVFRFKQTFSFLVVWSRHHPTHKQRNELNNGTISLWIVM